MERAEGSLEEGQDREDPETAESRHEPLGLGSGPQYWYHSEGDTDDPLSIHLAEYYIVEHPRVAGYDDHAT